MPEERSQQIDELCSAALKRAPDNRAAFLADACAGDEDLLREASSQLRRAQTTEPQAAPPVLNSVSGRFVRHYRIQERIGRGGLGEVFVGQDTILGRRVALKFLIADENAHEHLLEEARAAAALDHPFICKVFETGECDGKPYIVMEFLEGETLHQQLRSGPLAAQKAFTYGIEIAEALAAMHGKGLVHRDLKPANIMITSSGHVKVMDFGLARSFERPAALQPDDTQPMTMPCQVVGTPQYMAPEQAVGQDLDARADLFALGIVLYEMLTGSHPFHRDVLSSTLLAILSEPVPDIEQYLPGANSSLKGILLRALARNREERYQSAEQLKADLMALRDTGRVPDGPGDVTVIAILPFRDLSAQRDQQYFCDGLAEELMLALRTIERLRVVSRSAAFRFRNADTPLQEIGAALKAGSILEGSVRKAGDRLRILLNLVDVATGLPVWSEKYDRQLEDIFEIQDDVSRMVAEKLRVTFAASDVGRAVHAGAHNVHAYECYLKGRYLWNKRTEDSLRLSIEQYQRALAEDPDYAPAHAGIADTWVTWSMYGTVRPLEGMPLAKAAVNCALALAPSLQEALTVRARIRALFDWEWRAAVREFEAMLEANPRDAQARQWLAINCLAPLGEFGRAREQLKRAYEIEPVSLPIATSLGVTDFFEGDYDSAIWRFQGVLELDAGYYMAHYFLGQAYSGKQMHEEAIRELTLAAASRSAESLSALGYAHAVAGQHDEAVALLQELSIGSADRYVSPALLAQIQVGLGDFESAISNLEEACRMRATDLIWLKVRPAFRDMLADARVVRILADMGLTGGSLG